MPGPSSWPWSGSPASRRSVSRAPRPGRDDALAQDRVPESAATSAGTAHSTPSSPVYPVPATRQVAPAHSNRSTAKRWTVAASGETCASRARASGPCIAMTARSSVTSLPPMAATTSVVFEALGMTSNRSSSTHHTMMSSTTNPSSSRRWVYWARPGWIRVRSLLSECCRWPKASAPDDAHRAEMADVEGNRRAAAGSMLGHRSRRGRPAASPSRRTGPSWPRARGATRGAARPGARAAALVVGIHPARLGRSGQQTVGRNRARRSRAGTRWRSALRDRARACAALCGSSGSPVVGRRW